MILPFDICLLILTSRRCGRYGIYRRAIFILFFASLKTTSQNYMSSFLSSIGRLEGSVHFVQYLLKRWFISCYGFS